MKELSEDLKAVPLTDGLLTFLCDKKTKDYYYFGDFKIRLKETFPDYYIVVLHNGSIKSKWKYDKKYDEGYHNGKLLSWIDDIEGLAKAYFEHHNMELPKLNLINPDKKISVS